MAEEIKVVLEADASQLTGEFRKAQAAARSFSEKTMPGVSSALSTAAANQARLQRGMKDGAAGVKNYGQGFLQLAQFADDAQYGIRGVMNNIPGLVMAIGGGAGLAGALSLATLAGAKLLPVLKDVFAPGEDKEALAKVNEQLEILRQRSIALAGVRGSADAKAFIDQLDNEEASIRRQNEALSRSIDLMKARSIAAGRIADAKEQFELAKVMADPGLSDDAKQQQSAEIRERQSRRKEAEALAAADARAQEAARLADDKAAASQRANENYTRLRQEAEANQKRRQELLAKVNAGELAAASIPGAEAALNNMPSLKAFPGNMAAKQAAWLAEKQRRESDLEAMKARAATGASYRPEFSRVNATYQAQKKALDEMIEKEFELAEQTRAAAEARDHARKMAEEEKRAISETFKIAREQAKMEEQAASVAKQRALARDTAATMQSRVSEILHQRGVTLESAPVPGAARGRGRGLRINSLESSRGLRAHAEEVGRRRDASGKSRDDDMVKLLQTIAESGIDTKKALQRLGIL